MSTESPDEFWSVVSGVDGSAIEQAASAPESLPQPNPAPDAPSTPDAEWTPTERISVGAFATIAALTLIVSGLAFALSFDMMLAAAEHFGWSPQLAPLFPLLIDVGAIGGTVMGAISGNRTYRRTGRHVLAITLAASVVFNLAGHSIGTTLPGLPGEWKWTGTAAAILVPALLALFIHAFSKALRTFADQRRADHRRVDREWAGQYAVDVGEQPEVQTQQAGSGSDTAARGSAGQDSSPKPAKSAKSVSSARTPSAEATPKPKLDADTAIAWARSNNAGPTTTRRHFAEQGYQVPSVKTVQRWLNKE